MLFHEDYYRTLTDLGLTLPQSKVYLTLLKLGRESTVNTVFKFSSVPRQEVYRILSELQTAGLVEKIIANPAKFKAIPIREGLSALIEQINKKNAVLMTEATQLINTFTLIDATAETAIEGKSEFVLISEKELLIHRIEKAINATQESLKLIIPWKIFTQWIFKLQGAWNQAVARGVDIQLITEIPEDEKSFRDTLEDLSINPCFNFRTVAAPPKIKLLIYDGKGVFVSTQIEPNASEYPALWLNNPATATIVEGYFEMTWKTAESKKVK